MSSVQDRAGLSAVWHLLTLIAIGFAASVVLRGRHGLRHTTLMTAWWWSVLAMVAWIATWLADHCLSLLSPAAADHAWYGCALLAMCPPIAVLGARRPGIRAWSQFILLPMLLALGWPVLTLWFQGSELRGLQLEKPQLLACGLVVIMGLGNYCGTRFTLSALVYACALLASVASTSEGIPEWLANRTMVRGWCTDLLALAIGLTKLASRPTADGRFDRVWFDFFDRFGIVWGRRIQDRVNYLAQHEIWPVRLELHGFTHQIAAKDSPTAEADSGPTIRPSPNKASPLALSEEECNERLDHVLRWLLRRFVDHEWLDNRLKTLESKSENQFLVDS